MVRRRRCHTIGILGILLTAALGMARVSEASAPRLVSAVSRMTHGHAGAFDVTLPLNGASGIECRNVGGGMTLVFSFDQPVVSGTAAITAGTATINGAPRFAKNKMTVKLTLVADVQLITVRVSNVGNSNQETLAFADVPLRVLEGDVNASGAVSPDDVNITRAAIAKKARVNGSNFRSDYNLNGTLGNADANQIKTGALRTVGQAAANTAPTISQIANMTAISGQPTTPVGFTVNDVDTPDGSTLFVSATSNNQSVIPDANIALAGSGTSRTVTITPAAGLTSVVAVTITMTVSDGIDASAPMQFVVTVSPPPTIYLATLSPIPGVVSLAYGSATLTVSGDKTQAILKYNYSNLAGPDTDDAVYGPGDDVFYDVPVGKARGDQQPDGSYKWVFSALKAAQINSTIEANNAYMIIESAAYPAGELKGTFTKVTGSQIFVPPPNPPAITINPPTKFDASRFLQQAAFGGKPAEIAALSDAGAPNAGTAMNDWLEQQFAMPGPIYPGYSASAIAPVVGALGPQSASQPYSASSMYRNIYLRVTTAQPPDVGGDELADNRIHEAWWRNAITGPDQLRQRVATAYSEIWVVSELDAVVGQNLSGLATYYDMLANDAFANFRQILGDVTLHPIMGTFLNMKGNKKAIPPASPNENYAREILQLFSIGLYMLQPDGTLLLDASGQPIPTYDQTTITNFAQVFTGWDLDGNRVVIPILNAAGAVVNINSSYQRPMMIWPGDHSTTQKNLMVYPGAPTFPGYGQPGVIPARSVQTAATATAELNFALDNIFYHPNIGPFICKQLIQRLVGSNPSPAYVYRVVRVFNDDGSPQHVRGNMKAVITAILTDYEARSPALLSEPGYGRCREPLIRMANLLRSCGGYSVTGKWRISRTDATLNQTILRSPTVFNFFDPKYAEPGAVAGAGIVSPEMSIVYSTTITAAHNMIYAGIYNHNYSTPPTGMGFIGDSGLGGGSDVYLDFSAAGSGLIPLAQNAGSSAMIDQVAVLLMGAPMDPRMKRTVQTFVSTQLGATDYLGQVKAAVHLIATSAQAATQR